jgi:hypothetical protein
MEAAFRVLLRAGGHLQPACMQMVLHVVAGPCNGASAEVGSREGEIGLSAKSFAFWDYMCGYVSCSRAKALQV